MKLKISRLPFMFILVMLVSMAVGLLFFQPARPASASNAIPLQAPPFQEAASAQDAAVLAAIADEAGIAAYFHTDSQIILASVRDAFRTIEAETTDYIVGSIDVADYPELFDVHAYVHRDGWFMTYYLASDPSSKMVDLVTYTGGATVGTIFDKVLTILASEASVTFPGVTFWHFQYPNANRLMIIAEDFEDGNTFTVKLPSSYVFAERAWAAEGYCCQGWELDGRNVVSGDEPPMRAGVLGAAEMVPDTTYTIAVQDRSGNTGALVLVYSVP